MMLLQAGQLGLTRRDSIWTGDIPPEMIPGATMWIDGTDSATLWSGDNFTGTNVSTDAASVGSAHNKIYPSFGFNSTGPTSLKNPAVNSKSALVFASSSSRMDMYNSGAGGEATSLVLTASTKLILAAVKVSSAAANQSSPWTNDSVFADSTGYFGLHISDDSAPSGKLTARGFNYAGTSYGVSALFPRDEWVVLTMSHQGSTLRLRVNGGAWASTSTGNTDSMGGRGLIGNTPTSSTRSFELAHLLTANAAQTDAAISAVEHWIASDLGITPWW